MRTHRSNTSLPKGVEIHNNGEQLEIVRVWFAPKYLFAIGMTLFLLYATWHLHLETTGAYWGAKSLILLTPVCLTLFTTYISLTGLFNRTTISMNRTTITVQHRPIPIPFYRDKSINVKEVRKVDTNKNVTHVSNQTKTITFEVILSFKGKRTEKLLFDIDKKDHADFIAEEIRSYLLANKPNGRG